MYVVSCMTTSVSLNITNSKEAKNTLLNVMFLTASISGILHFTTFPYRMYDIYLTIYTHINITNNGELAHIIDERVVFKFIETLQRGELWQGS